MRASPLWMEKRRLRRYHEASTYAASPIIEDTSWTGPIAWAPDGKRLAYVRQGKDESGEESETSSLWVCDLASGERHKVCDLPHNAPEAGTHLEWSADSAQIGFIMKDEHSEGRAIGCTVQAEPEATVREGRRYPSPLRSGIGASPLRCPGTP